MGSSFKLGRVFGVDLGVHWSWILIFLLVTWSFATGILPDLYPAWTTFQLWLAGAFVALIFFLSILAHELSHALVSNRSGLPVRSITLFVFGGVSNLSRDPDTAGLEFRIAIVGPLTSLLLAAVFAAAWAFLRPISDGLAGIAAYLALINAMLAVFNMLPGFPLDGGRVFRSIVWARNGDYVLATRTAARLGGWIAYGVMGLGLAYVLVGNLVGGVWLLIIGFFLRNISAASYEQVVVESAVGGLTAEEAMRREFETVAPDLSIERLVHDHILRSNEHCFAVVDNGSLMGLITLADVRSLPRDEWALLPVSRAMTPLEKLHTVTAHESMHRVLELMATHDVQQIPVLDGQALAGLVSRSQLIQLIRTRQELGGVPPTLPTHAEPPKLEERQRRAGPPHVAAH